MLANPLTMAPGSRFNRRNSDQSDKPDRFNVLTRSPSSPQTSEVKPRVREPYPVPSNNPANQYTLLEKLGTGSFGTVYKAMHNETKQIVAIKQIGVLLSLVTTISQFQTHNLPQTWKTLMTIYPRYNRRSPVSHNVTRNT